MTRRQKGTQKKVKVRRQRSMQALSTKNYRHVRKLVQKVTEGRLTRKASAIRKKLNKAEKKHANPDQNR